MIRFFVVSILYFLSTSSFSQPTQKPTLLLSINDCRGRLWYGGFLYDTVLFYKLPEDSLAFTILPGDYQKPYVLRTCIPVAEYKMVYKNYFDQYLSYHANITAKDTNRLTICFDTLASYPQNTLKKLKENDSLSIHYQLQGCFGGDDQTIIIRKNEKEFVATIFYKKQEYFQKKKRVSIIEKLFSETTVLTSQNIADFIRFENELNFTDDKKSCTSRTFYRIESKYLNVQRIDGGCRWNGFYFLKRSFFGEE